jgi:hypothetical protein
MAGPFAGRRDTGGTTVTLQRDSHEASKLLDKAMLRQTIAALEERMGLPYDPAATAEEVQALLLARGVRPEDRFLSGEVLRMRQEPKGVV